MNKQAEEVRLLHANTFIEVISSCGREFFKHDDFVSFLELSESGRVFFIDYYTRERIYTHLDYTTWSGFTSGGTLKQLIILLRDYIKKGKKMKLDYFHHENHWGYGDDIMLVRNAAKSLGIAK